MMIRRPNLENYWKSFIRPFDNTLWWLTVVTIVLVPLLLTYSYMKGRETGSESTDGPVLFNLQESFLIIYGALLQQGQSMGILLYILFNGLLNVLYLRVETYTINIVLNVLRLCAGLTQQF